jgi:hypothetical protein
MFCHSAPLVGGGNRVLVKCLEGLLDLLDELLGMLRCGVNQDSLSSVTNGRDRMWRRCAEYLSLGA